MNSLSYNNRLEISHIDNINDDIMVNNKIKIFGLEDINNFLLCQCLSQLYSCKQSHIQLFHRALHIQEATTSDY
jgi:hypothetical protein